MVWVMIGCSAGSPAVHASPVPVPSTPLGSVVPVAASELRADDADWGGWSGASIHDGALTAVSDVGGWMTLHLDKDPDGDLVGVSSVRRGHLLGEDGVPFRSKGEADAEAIAADPDGGFVVALERHHRLLRYATIDGRPTALALPDGFRAPVNGGLEAFGRIGGDRWLALVEGEDGDSGPHPGWVGAPGAWSPLSVERVGAFLPVELVPLPDGGELLIERSFSRSAGVAIRVTRLDPAAIVANAVLSPVELAILRPGALPVDNFEAAGADADGVYLLSDDNQSGSQRTILLQLRLD